MIAQTLVIAGCFCIAGATLPAQNLGSLRNVKIPEQPELSRSGA